jgi:hypothetical protein
MFRVSREQFEKVLEVYGDPCTSKTVDEDEFAQVWFDDQGSIVALAVSVQSEDYDVPNMTNYWARGYLLRRVADREFRKVGL